MRMKSPRFGESGVHQPQNMFAWLVALTALLIGVPCQAQSAGVPDSAVAAPADSARTDSVRTDSARMDSARTDGARNDSARTDSAAVAPRDSLARPGADSTTPTPSPAALPAPVDSVLGAACEETAEGVPDVLLVTFRPSTTDSERSAVAQQFGGAVLGMSQHAAPGSWYVQLPGSADDPAIADRLILLPPVLEVGSTRCPS
jgi:hypothetical protein